MSRLIPCLIVLSLWTGPFLYSDPAQVDGYEFLIDQGEWIPCQVDAGKMKCDLGSLPLGGHLLRGRAVVAGVRSEGKAWLFVFKRAWYGTFIYYVLKMNGESISWEVQAIK